jgi:hypothetical protein
LLLLIEAKLS